VKKTNGLSRPTTTGSGLVLEARRQAHNEIGASLVVGEERTANSSTRRQLGDRGIAQFD
jgi:hypothetical protein